MTALEALSALREMYDEIDSDNWLFVGTINPDMIKWAITALERMEVDNEQTQ